MGPLRACLLLGLLAAPLAAQEPSGEPLDLNLPTAASLADWDMAVRFTHRFQEQAKGSSKDLYGLDNGAYTGLGFDLGIRAVPGLNLQIYRTSDRKTLTLALQEQVVASPHWRLAFRAERFDETVKGGLVGGAFQAPLDWRPVEAFTLTLVPTYLSRTATARSVVTAGLALDWRFTARQGILAEVYPRPSKVDGAFERGWAVGYQFRTRGHRFSILATNELGTTAHQVLGGDYEGFGPRPSGSWALGFNLVRLF